MRLIREQKGVALIIAIIFAFFASFIACVLLSAHTADVRSAQHSVDSASLLYLAESGVQKALYQIIQNDKAGTLPTATVTLDDLTLAAETGVDSSYLDNMPVDVRIEPLGSDRFRAVSIATLEQNGDKLSNATKGVAAVIAKYTDPIPCKVFDYVYFVNNWGWFFGNAISARGDVRSNGNFDFRYNPTVNGLGDVFIEPLPEGIFAADEINTYGGQVRGTANKQEDGVYVNQHAQTEVLPMPNLQDLSEYEELATEKGSTISIGGTVVVNGIYGDDASESGNIVLVGTVQNPIVIDGPNVIRNDVIIKGVITGQGTLYSGRNIYVADNITYANPPGKAMPNESGLDNYYESNKDKDLVGFAARESIVLGDCTSTSFSSNSYNSYLRYMGDEDVGRDSILGTDDTGEGDGNFDPLFEDIDGDGAMDDYYALSYFKPNAALSTFGRLPAGVTSFSQLSTNSVQFLDGVFYTNHAMAGCVSNLTLFGALVSKDEAIIFQSNFNLVYDVRIHSYFTSKDPLFLIDLGLPTSESYWQLGEWEEVVQGGN